MCSDTLDPGGEVRGCSVGLVVGMSGTAPFVFILVAGRSMGFLQLKTKSMLFQGGVLWVRRDFVLFSYRRTVRTCPFVSHAVSLDESGISWCQDGQQKRSRGYHNIGTSAYVALAL